MDIFHVWFATFLKGSKGLHFAQSSKGQYLTLIPATLNLLVTGVLQGLIVIYSGISSLIGILTFTSDKADGFKPDFKQTFVQVARQGFYSFVLPSLFLIPNYLLMVPQLAQSMYFVKANNYY